jgi:hypothetical protein
MSMVPDLPLDDDELPIAEYRPSMAQIGTLEESDEEDEEVDSGENKNETTTQLALQLSLTSIDATTDYTSLPELASVQESDVNESDEQGPWMHRGITKEEAEARLQVGKQDGHFLVRERPGVEGEFVLSLIYKGAPTHHLMRKNEDGVITINRKVVGLPAPSTLTEAIKLVTAEICPAGWPLRLRSFPPCDGASEEAVSKAKLHFGL